MLALLAAAQPAVAQVTETGTIEVLVQDASGLPIPGATVVASATDTVTKREAVSDAEGRALLVGLAPSAHYIVTTELTGFRSARNENVLVRSGLTATVRVPLAVGGVTEQVQVTRRVADRRLAERDDGAGHHLAADRIASDRPFVPELLAARARGVARRPAAAR